MQSIMCKILVIEDNKTLRENLAEMLGFSGYNVTVASDGIQGLNEIKNEKPDLIICDVMMPKLDGFGLLKTLNSNPIYKHIPLIFLTAKSDSGDFRKGMGLGAQDYITKPFDDAELLEAITIRLEKHTVPAIKNIDQKLHITLTEKEFKARFENYYSDVKQRTYKSREAVFELGRKVNYVYFILKGQIRLSQTNKSNKEYSHNIKKEGDYFGIVELYLGDSYTYSAYCISDVDLLVIPKQNFVKFMENDVDAQNTIYNLMSTRILELQNEAVKIAYNSVRQKVAESLVKLRTNESLHDDEVVINREDLSTITGTAKESLIRTLSDFKNEKLIEIKGRRIILKNTKSLIDLYE